MIPLFIRLAIVATIFIVFALFYSDELSQKKVRNELISFNGYDCLVTDTSWNYAELTYLDRDERVMTVYIPLEKAIFLLDQQTDQ